MAAAPLRPARLLLGKQQQPQRSALALKAATDAAAAAAAARRRVASGFALSRRAETQQQLSRAAAVVSVAAAPQRQQQKPIRPSVATRSSSSASFGGDSSSAASDESDTDDLENDSAFKRARWATFIAMFVGYGAFYLTRNSLAFTAPAMLEDKSLGLTLKSVGALTSVLPVMYGVSKFASGVLGARTHPTLLLGGGLAATALANIAVGASSSFPLFMLFWGVNGLLQGLGAPACARILTSWYPEALRGTFWGFWTASNNVGGFFAPILAGSAAAAYGWRWGMFAPGLVAIVSSLWVFAFMKESPESMGFPAVAGPVKLSKAQKKAQKEAAAAAASSSPSTAAAAADKTPAPPKKPSMIRTLLDDVLTNPHIWLLAIAYFFVYVIRQGVTSWFVFYLKERGAANPAVAVSGLELGGLVGSLSSGAISDALLRRNEARSARDPTLKPRGNLGLRVLVVVSYTLLTALFLGAFAAAPASTSPALLWLLVSGVGFALYGPQMLIGLCGAEAVPRHAVSAALGFLGWVSYLGAANAGVPLAALVQSKGWEAYFSALAACCGIVVLLMVPMALAPSWSQRERARVAAELAAAEKKGA